MDTVFLYSACEETPKVGSEEACLDYAEILVPLDSPGLTTCDACDDGQWCMDSLVAYTLGKVLGLDAQCRGEEACFGDRAEAAMTLAGCDLHEPNDADATLLAATWGESRDLSWTLARDIADGCYTLDQEPPADLDAVWTFDGGFEQVGDETSWSFWVDPPEGIGGTPRARCPRRAATVPPGRALAVCSPCDRWRSSSAVGAALRDRLPPMPPNLPLVDPRTRAAWRRWLADHHDRASETWLVFHKKHTGVACLSYDEAVTEALCFGWVDSLVRRLDDDRYAQKFTPRRPDSKWSSTNRRRYTAAVEQGLVTPAGAALPPNDRDGDAPKVPTDPPAWLARALRVDERAWAAFEKLAPSCRREYVAWITTAKREETRQRRLAEALRLLGEGKKLGMK